MTARRGQVARRQARNGVRVWMPVTAFLVIALILAYVWAIRGHFPTRLEHASETLALLNPLRDRTPETLAEQLVDRVAGGQCREALGEAGLSSDLPCPREEAWPMLNHVLAGRLDSNQRAYLTYKVTRRDSHSGRVFGSSATVVVRREGESWSVFMYFVPPR